MVYQIQCSWCGKHMGTKEDAGSDFAEKLKSMGLPILSHGCCSKCRQQLNKKYNLKGTKNVL